jgi:uncharacterized protein
MSLSKAAGVKVVIAGPFNAGKTTLISTLSEIPVVSSERNVTSYGADADEQTTVAIDFGRMTVPPTGDEPGTHLYLFGTPGQVRFDYIWDVAAQGMLGLALIVDASKPETWNDAASILGYFKRRSDRPFLIGANRSTSPEENARIAAALKIAPELVRPVQAVEKESAKSLLIGLLELILIEQLVFERDIHGIAPTLEIGTGS